MSPRHTAVIVWTVALFFLAAGYALGRTAQVVVEPLEDPIVVAGDDVGFRVVGRQNDKAVGHLVVRLNGKWVETAPYGTVTRVPR